MGARSHNRRFTLMFSLLLLLSGVRVAMPVAHWHSHDIEMNLPGESDTFTHSDCLLCLFISTGYEEPSIQPFVRAPLPRLFIFPSLVETGESVDVLQLPQLRAPPMV